VICGCDEEVAPVAARAELLARWTAIARGMVDAPANLMSPTELSERVVKFAHLDGEIVDPAAAGPTR
jgi:leucyl aminopeptidase